MKSPFPGMDPFIEANGLWEDFHDDLIGEIKRALAGVLPERYYVQTGQRSYIVVAGVDEKKIHLFKPDVGVLSPTGRERKPRNGSSTAVIEEQSTDEVTVRAFIDEEYRENFIEIFEEEESQPQLVTCLEILSPSNKRARSKGRKIYLRKRNARLLGTAHFVEIDLLRTGKRMPMLDPLPDSPYYILLCRQQRAPYCRVRKAYFDRALPDLTIPLAGKDPDVILPLQPLVDAVYERLRYRRRIDYGKPLTLPLTAEQNEWLQTRLRSGAPAKRQRTPKRGGRRK